MVAFPGRLWPRALAVNQAPVRIPGPPGLSPYCPRCRSPVGHQPRKSEAKPMKIWGGFCLSTVDELVWPHRRRLCYGGGGGWQAGCDFGSQ